MKFMSRRIFSPLNGFLLAALVAGCSPGSQVPSDVAAVPGCTVAQADFATWFKTGSPTLNGEVTPADSIGFGDHPNCDFYVWSERMFLWAMSPPPPSYGGGERIFASPIFFDVSPADANNQRSLIRQVGSSGTHQSPQMRIAQTGPHDFPLIRSKSGQLFEVAPTELGPSKLPMIRNLSGRLTEIRNMTIEKGKPLLFDLSGAPIEFMRPRERALTSHDIPLVQKFTLGGTSVFIGSEDFLLAEQAEADDGVVVAQNNSLVYYTVEVNDVYGYLASGLHSNSITGISRFPTNGFTLGSIQYYQHLKGGSGNFPDGTALAIELKTAWVEAVNLPPGCSYVEMRGQIPDYDQTDPAHWKKKPNTRAAMLALVAMHVVGSARNHPEMIWATFEHVCNAPGAADRGKHDAEHLSAHGRPRRSQTSLSVGDAGQQHGFEHRNPCRKP
jgi:hypothetical protein